MLDGSDLDIINGAIDMASTSIIRGAGASRWCGRGFLEEVRDCDISLTFIARFRRRMMKKAAVKMAMSRNTAPPIMPPIWDFVIPVEDILLAFVFATGSANADILGKLLLSAVLLAATLLAAVGSPTIVAETMVVVMVSGFALESVVVIVSVRV